MCAAAEPGKGRCPLCHGSITPGEDSWRIHLMSDSINGCQHNPRRLQQRQSNKSGMLNYYPIDLAVVSVTKQKNKADSLRTNCTLTNAFIAMPAKNVKRKTKTKRAGHLNVSASTAEVIIRADSRVVSLYSC